MKIENIIIFGTGKYGSCLLQLFEKMSVRTDFFCVSKKNTDEYMGIEIIDLESISTLENDSVVFVALKNRQESKKIKNRLMHLDQRKLTIIEANTLIESYNKNIDLDRYQNNEKKYCVFCDSEYFGFKPWKTESDILNINNISGAGNRSFAYCPVCGSKDRERWLYYVLKNETEIFEERSLVLYFAPEHNIIEILERNTDCIFYTADINPQAAANIVDVIDIPYKNDIFDYIIINHVLNYIKDEKRALSELKRVLKPDGKLIISFPVNLDNTTFDAPDDCSITEKIENIGDANMVRLYGTDYVKRLEDAGFRVRSFSPKDSLSNSEIDRQALIYNDIVNICTK